MNKIGIVTINDNNNYGNRLQNYALQEFLVKENCEAITLRNEPNSNFIKRNWIKRLIRKVLKTVKNVIKKVLRIKKLQRKRLDMFNNFNKNIKFSKRKITPRSDVNSYKTVITGSDQVWNPYFARLSDLDLLNFKQEINRISFAASFGINDIPEERKEDVSKKLKKFNFISVREERGKEIVEELTGRNDVEVLVDPTMLLTAEEWDRVSKKPEQLNFEKKYILNYFLGELSEDKRSEINRIAKENDCEVINILDKESPFYATGPSEFLYLEKHAFLICTDSFHSSVFAILYNRPFIVFERESKTASMNSRIDTLLTKFKLENRKFNETCITKENLNHDYTVAYEILDKERSKSENFIKKALDIKE